MWTRSHALLVPVALSLLPGCGEMLQDLGGGTIESTMKVDGTAYVPAACSSGDLENFRGVDLLDRQGNRIRLVKEVDGSASMILFPPGVEVGSTIRGCVSLRLENTGVRINNVRVVKGQASFRCTDPGGQRIEGDLTFRCGIP